MSPGALVGKHFPDLLTPAEAPVIVEILHRVIENCIGAVITASFEGSNGTRWMQLSVIPIEAGPEDAPSIALTCRAADPPDIVRSRATAALPTERPTPTHTTSANLPADGNQFRDIVDNMRDFVCEIGVDGRILHASPSYAECFGGTTDGLVGSDPLEPVHLDDRRRLAQILRPGTRSRRLSTLAYRARNAAGEWLDLEATAREYAGFDGRRRVVVVSRDVTEREKARRHLERHIALEARVAELSRFFIDVEIDAIGEGIQSRLARVADLADAQHSWMYSFPTGRDAFDHFEWWRSGVGNPTPHSAMDAMSQFSYSTGLIIGGRVYHVSSLDELPEEAEAERQDMRERGVRSILGIPIMSGGRFVGFLGFENYEHEISWPEETIMLLRMVGEIFYSALRRRRAVEDLRHSQNQLLQSQKMEAVGTLAGGIAHDFNNHLAVMLGNSRFLRQEVSGDEDTIAAIEDIERAADHCAQLTRSLLTFSRRSPVEIVPVEVSDVVEGVDCLVRPLLPSQFQLETSLDSDLGMFAVDRVQIQQVLVNLLVNARDSMSEGGGICLKGCRRQLNEPELDIEGLEADKEYVVLSVEDSGHGIDEATLGRIFEPFFTTKGVSEGTGLGLAMAYGIVRQSGGAITVESRTGKGSTFHVYLPGLSDRAD